jgi:hypothetical protein
VGKLVSPNVVLIGLATAVAVVLPQATAALYFAVTIGALVRSQ